MSVKSQLLWPLLVSMPWAVSAGASSPTAELDGCWGPWLAATQHWMLDAEYAAFVELDDEGKEAFKRRFWQARHPGPDLWRNPVRQRWRGHFEAVYRQFGQSGSDRAQAMLIAGKPDRSFVFEGCLEPIHDLEIWRYEPWQAMSPDVVPTDGAYLLFYRSMSREGSYFKQLSRHDNLGELAGGELGAEVRSVRQFVDVARSKRCFDLDAEATRLLATALENAMAPAELMRAMGPAIPDPGWLDELMSELAERSSDRPVPRAGMTEISFPAGQGPGTLVRARIEVPAHNMQRSYDHRLFDRFVITGQVWSQGFLVDDFRSVQHVVGKEPGERVFLEAHRLLRPGDYTMCLRAKNGDGQTVLRERLMLAVPSMASEPVVEGHAAGAPRVVDDVPVVMPTLELQAPDSALVVGKVEIRAVTSGMRAERVDFQLDGEPVGSVRRPPFIAELRLGRAPRRHRVSATAFDADGRPLARDDLVLNAGPHRFAVRLEQSVLGGHGELLRVEVEIPEGRSLDRVELYADDALSAVLYQSPFMHALPEQQRAGTGFVRAVAHLQNGESVEDIAFLQAPFPAEEVEVRWVELYTSVIDENGRFVADLTPEAFEVFENGARQPLTRFDILSRIPVHVAVLLDLSKSMSLHIEQATSGAVRFFDTVLKADDRAAFLTFHHEVRLVVPFTGDVDRLRRGVSFSSLGFNTRLFDSVIHGQHYFAGLGGKRALVIISDGMEFGSRFRFSHVLDYTRRSGVAVYPILFNLVDPLLRSRLERLAGESGGRYFAVDDPDRLGEVYESIERELRSQYLLVYQAPESSDHEAFRRVEVKVKAGESELKARTMHGYFPD